LEGRTLYEGVRKVIPTRDGMTVLTSRGVFIDGVFGVFTLPSRRPLYVGYDYMVLSGIDTVIAGGSIGVITLPQPGRLIFNGNRDDGTRPVKIVYTARDGSINGWISVVAGLREYYPGIFIAEGVRYTDEGYVEGLHYDAASSTIGGGYPLLFTTGLQAGQDRMVYNVDGEGSVAILLRYPASPHRGIVA